MFHVHFEKMEEAKELISSLSKMMSSSLFVQGIEILHNSCTVTIQHPTDAYEDSLFLLRDSLKEFIKCNKREEWFNQLLEQQYYYSDSEERLQILHIFHSILEGERENVEPFPFLKEEERLLEEAIQEFLLEQSSIFFESFETFRLKPYLEHLRSYIDIAIDEYKMELEYQAFIHMLRDFLNGRQSVYDKILLVDEDGFQFFLEDGSQLKRQELSKLIDRKLLTNHPIYVDSIMIAPLISIAPKEVYVYTDSCEQGIVLTLKNIFEEKIKVFPLRSCFIIKK